MTLRRAPSDKTTIIAYKDKSGTMRRLPGYVLVFDRVEQ
jgi:hypothetical protein